ncbi:MAG: HD domain-containing phosphohydrolase [Alphaproteobacteria bacterium]
MTDSGVAPTDLGTPPRRAGLTFGLVLLALVIAAILAVKIVFSFVNAERARDLREWQIRLGIVADSRLAAVNDWLERQYADLAALAQNASLQIYMTELSLSSGDKDKVTEAAAQAGYLRNLLIVAASRGGFTGRALGPEVNANVKRVGVAGIALVGMDGHVVVSTPDMPPIEGFLHDFIASLPRGQRAATNLYLGAGGNPSMAFATPIFAVQSEGNASQQIGLVLGVKEVGAELYPLLKQPGEVEKTAETELVRSDENTVEYLSPLKDGTPPLTRKLALTTPELDAAFAVKEPGSFSIRTDYSGTEVLVTSRAFTLVPWALVYKVDRKEALADSDARRGRLLVVLLLSIGFCCAAILAVWWHASSRRAREAAAKYQALASRYENQGRFLQLVTDSQPTTIFIVDVESGKIRFANRAAAERAGVSAADLIGKTLASVFGPDEAKRYMRYCDRAAESNTPVAAVERVLIGDQSRVLQAEHIPLAKTETEPGGILVVERDITAAVTERERRERILRQLVRTLVAVVDRRDPFAANHSVRVGAVARAVAEEMGLDSVSVETVEIAGNLMNLGKILIPEGVLTRAGTLSEDEMRRIRDSLQATANLLAGIEFDGPVVETLRQLQEHWDGSGGPNGLKGENILLTARVVAVANAFVAMVSPRAYRPGVEFDRAVETLLSQVGRAFDRRVVAALVNYLDSRGGRQRWADFARGSSSA